MKRILSLILAVCIISACAAVFGGCSQETSSDWPVTVNGVTVTKEPKSIVVLSDKLADIISYIGYDIKMVGRAAECDQDFLYVVPVTGYATNPDVAAMTAANTDLVIADSAVSDAVRQNIESAGIKVVTFAPATNEDELRELYISLGTVLGGKETGSKKGESGYDELMSMLNTLNTASSAVRQTAAYLYLDESGQLCSFVKGSIGYKFFNYNGCTNVLLNQSEPVVNTEELRIDPPIYLFYDSPEVLTVLMSDPNTANMPAMTNGRALQLSKKNFERLGASVEKTVYDMLEFIEKDSKSTADEAAAAETTAKTEAGTAAPQTEAAEETAAEEASAADDAVVQ